MAEERYTNLSIIKMQKINKISPRQYLNMESLIIGSVIAKKKYPLNKVMKNEKLKEDKKDKIFNRNFI